MWANNNNQDVLCVRLVWCTNAHTVIFCIVVQHVLGIIQYFGITNLHGTSYVKYNNTSAVQTLHPVWQTEPRRRFNMLHWHSIRVYVSCLPPLHCNVLYFTVCCKCMQTFSAGRKWTRILSSQISTNFHANTTDRAFLNIQHAWFAK